MQVRSREAGGGGDDYRRGETEWGEKGRREREGRRGWGKREKGEERCMPDLPPLIPSPPLSSLFFPLPLLTGADRTLVFVETKRNADYLASLLSQEEFPTTSIHG